MELALINAIPFLMALLLGIPASKTLLPKAVRAWGSAAVMAMLFVALLAYFPQVQEIDTQYKQQQGISTEYHSEDASYESEDAGQSEGDESDSEDAQASGETETVLVGAADENPATEQPPASDDTTETDDLADGERITVNAVVQTITWVPELGLELSFYLDGLSLLFGLIITGIGAGIFLYAGYYFEDNDDQSRFITVLFAFAGAMLGLVLSGNLLTLFVMWELTSITSFLLIGFKGAKSEDARFGAMQAFAVTGIGALGLIAGVVLLAFISGDVLNGGGMVFDLAQILTADPDAVAAHPLYVGALVLLAFGAFTKSAQFPFHFWLPGAMAAPTPASAYLHSATMVKAGVYLLLRLYPPMHAGDLWTNLLVTFGIGTMVIGALISIFQRDLKGLLAYATVSWLGALVGMIGLPDGYGLKAAYVGILAHALYKAAMFLAAGTIDHNVGTRIVDKLGGLRKQMPVIAGVVTISALSMAGLPIFFGFVAKEVLLKDWLEASFAGAQIAYWGIIFAAALLGTSGYIFIWDVFFKKPTEEIHFHASPWPMAITPVLLAVCSTLFGFFLDPPITFVEDLIAVGIPKAIDIHLLPPSATDPVFLTSLAIVAAGFVVFLVRGFWLPIMQNIPIPRATDMYKAIVAGIDWIGDQVVKTQNGRVRYYLVVILGTMALVILSSGIINDLARGQDVFANPAVLDAATVLRIILLALAIVAALLATIVRSHMTAALGLGVLGYAVGGLFLLEPAPDVAMVQFLIETLATILVIVLLGRTSAKLRRDAMGKLWKGRSMVGNFNVGILRDLFIAGSVGVAVFFFSLTAFTNRPDRDTIADYHLANTYEKAGIEDVVGAIVADFRAMDTLIEIGVFATAALGVLMLLNRGISSTGIFSPGEDVVKKQEEFEEDVLESVSDTTNLSTPFTRFVARLVLPLAFLFALSNIINGGFGPGDGFTAGAIAGLATALWFVIFGYEDAKQRLLLFAPHRIMRAGLFVSLLNALMPILFSLENGTFMAHVDYGKLLGIYDVLQRFGLSLSSGILFEVGIALTVFGAVGAIMEAIAHPKASLNFETDDH